MGAAVRRGAGGRAREVSLGIAARSMGFVVGRRDIAGRGVSLGMGLVLEVDGIQSCSRCLHGKGSTSYIDRGSSYQKAHIVHST